ncbi:MAG: exodeoxyribonuclease VII small subunit [Prevotella sp.]|nr:exodeoxyribonuclease VII small subunit [Prevotella sp.]
MEKEQKYEAAFAELQTIMHKMENDELDIDQLTEQLRRAQQLIKFCRDKLTKTDEEIKKILAES